MSEMRRDTNSGEENPPKPESANAEEKVNDVIITERHSTDIRIESPDRAVKPVKMHDPPAVFQILKKKNTNLNEPPSNWLHGSSRWQSRLHQTSFPFDNFFSSFNMANSFLNMTGIVDVISDSQNIKKLLKMTLSKANISMVVHRVNNTLLLDNLDIHSLLRQKDGDWELFRKFYYDIVTEDIKLPVVERKNKSRDYLQSRNMFSKLLYYCLAGEQQSSSPDSQSNISNSECGSNDLSPRTVVWNFEDIRMLIGTDLPIFGRGSHPCVSVKLRDMNKPISVLTGLDNWLDNLMCNVPELAMCYHDNGIIQSYEVLKTEDIPNCSDFKFSPSVIKDIAQNILSFLKSNATKEGHTYWLFKAHEGDIVKLYDLTTLCNNNSNDENITGDNKSGEPTTNPFTTPVGNLLYRLTVNLRCKQVCPSRGKKVPVIKKLLKNCISLFDSSKNYQMVTSCHYFLSDLFVCDHLEEPELQSESSESDVEDNDSMENNSSDDDEEEEKKMARSHKKKSQLIEEATSFIKVQSLTAHKQPGKKKSTNNNKKKKKSSKSAFLNKCTLSTAEVKNDDAKDDFLKRSSRALKHIELALRSLEKYHPSPTKNGSSCSTREPRQEKISKPFDELKQCNPNEAIPLHYIPLKPQSQTNQRGKDFNEILFNTEGSGDGKEVCERNFSLSRVPKDIDSPFASKAIDTDLWHRKPRIFLLRKTCIVYLKRSKSKLVKSQLMTSVFQDGDKALRCYCSFGKLVNATSSGDLYLRCQHDPELFISIVTTLGDAYLQAAHLFMQAKSIKDEMMEEEDFEKDLLRMAESVSDMPFDVEMPKDAEHSFEKSLKCYLLAEEVMEKYLKFIEAKDDKRGVKNYAKPLKSLNEIRRRQANAYNEYGKHYFMQVVLPNGTLNPNWEIVMVASQKYYMKSFKIFMLINDRLNAALVMANDCNVTRQRASMIRKLTVEESMQFSPEEEELYKMAEICYGTALKLLKCRESSKETWDVIQWELVTMLVNVASLLQDNPPIDRKPADEIVKDVIVKFTETLEHCQFEPSSSKYIPALYRKAHIHHRMASLYQKTFLNAETKSEMRESKQAAEKHHRYAYDIFVSIDSGCELIRLQLERIGLSENCLTLLTSEAERIKILERTVELLLQCRQSMKVVVDMVDEIFSKFSRQESLKDGSSHTMSASSMSEFSNDVESIIETLKLSEILQSKLSSTFLSLLHVYKKRSEDGAFNLYKTMYQKCITSESGRFDWSSACTYWKMFSKCMTNFFLEWTVKAKNESKNECIQLSENESCTYLSMLRAILLQLPDSTASVKNSETALQDFYIKLKCLSSVSMSILTILEEVQRSKNFRKF